MNTMNSPLLANSKIYVAGHRGLAGSAIVRRLEREGCSKVLVRSHQELDLTDQAAVASFFAKERPEHVFLAAAKVGGILANNTRPAEFIHENLAIQTNVIQAAYDVGVRRLLFFGSSCIYPRDCPQPIREEYMLTGPLESTNRPYAVAKIAGVEMCWAFNRQYGTRYISAMPTNLYGPNDNYDLAGSHVLPALLRKMHEAKLVGASEVVVWGTGNVRREFLHSDDMADACVFLMKLSDDAYGPIAASESQAPLLNIGCGEDLTVQELAELIRDVVGFEGRLVFDTSKPDGTPRKLLDVSRMKELGWHAGTSLRKGLTAVYREYSDILTTAESPAVRMSARYV
ncbi:GDP-L-fucose synthase [Granulicella aggregans]|uniref:GDP-L-fucose synthase n=1 Tax=Granulicella aggregans TaxID=474949 RepID=A0A7W7ZCH5_9BACT|nr:GDP-L-fucose synthase [Granulicella aggregans]MBB5057292.1 GDP-L-fucose synthase [Granulicella aggregans]